MRTVWASSDVVVPIVTLAVNILLSLPSLGSVWSWCTSRHRQVSATSDHYADKDGAATEESESASSDLLQRSLLLIAAVSGFTISTVFLIATLLDLKLRCSSHEEECHYNSNPIWLQQCFVMPTWLLLLIQSSVTCRSASSLQKHRLGVFGALSSLFITVSLVVEIWGWQLKHHVASATRLHYAFALAQLVLSLLLTSTFVLIPRRPDVFLNGQIVDKQYTVSLLSRITFSWATPLLGAVASKKGLDHDDLPVISNDIRAKTLHHKFEVTDTAFPVWRRLFRANRYAFMTQWTLQVCQSFANFLPQIALYLALRLLEARDEGEDTRFELWALVLFLGISDAICAWLESVMFAVCYLKLGVPIYEQLSAVVFGKSIRKKDVKGVSGKAEIEQEDATVVINEASGSKGEDTAVEEGVENDVAKTKQSTINLIGVDGKRIADFATYNCMVLGSVLKIFFAIVFLVKLVGWIPMLSGFAAFVAMFPLNWWVSSNYTTAQDVLMNTRDSKMAVVTEALQGIRQIKFSALEKEWYEKIGKSRKKELSTQWRVFCFDVALISIWIFGPVALSAISLSVYALIYKQLTASVAFTTIAIFEAIEVTLGVVPELITELFDALVSCRRIQEYLDSPDQEDVLEPGKLVNFLDATIAWPSDDAKPDVDRFMLRNLNISFPHGKLSIISGKTGAGKSLLLSSIIGEADVTKGNVTVPQAPALADRYDHKANKENWIIPAAIAYVAQIPWIENGSIQENILFGLPMDKERYGKVLHASAMEKDLEILPDGDLTDIGTNGINLSGGQKWRVSFARALYSRAGILVLDDIFSAVDAHVGRHLFEYALTGEICNARTRILVTHHVGLCLPRTDYSVVLENGSVLQAGPTEDLRRNGVLKDILAFDVEQQKKEENVADMNSAVTIDDGGSLQKIRSHLSDKSRTKSALSDAGLELMRTKSHISQQSTAEAPKKFTEEEKRETGAVKLSIYNAYIQACGGYIYWMFILSVFVTWTVVYLCRSYWVSVWTRAYQTESETFMHLSVQPAGTFGRFKSEIRTVDINNDLSYYLGVYVAIALTTWFIGTTKYFIVCVASIRASKKLFEDICHAVLRAPLRFLDTTPVGRILNRFTADFNMIDSKISSDLAFTMHSGVTALAVVIAGVFVSPFMLIAAACLLVVCTWYALRFLAAAREVKRLESNAKSPVFEQFGSVLAGIGTIRAFGRAEAYIEKMENRINRHCQAYFHRCLFNRWMALRVGFVGSIFLTAMGALVVGIPAIDAPLAGFALSFSLQLSDGIIWLLRQYSDLELDMNAIERVVEYSRMPVEDQGGNDAPAAWPTKGEMEVNDLVIAYAPDLSPVLRGLSFSVKQNERVGVVGRTGAGKSSLTLALFRFLEARSGSVHIDGLDISKIKLFDLRSRLAIIPQDPVLFSGTVRSNLDPFDQHSDTELRDALSRVHLVASASAIQSGTATPIRPSASDDITSDTQSTNRNLFTSLQSKISEGGLNLSQGQRQLLCLARAIVSRPKIMVLDEATSSVDMDTDALIQRSIREEFADSTLIVIAHRLSTIADFDRILVLGEGQVLEFDTPTALMKKESGVFRGMVEDSGERRELESIIQEE